MNEKPRQRRSFFRGGIPMDSRVQGFYDWLPANRSFYLNFRAWLKESGYSPSALNLYGVAVRQAIGYLQKPYWQIDPEQDIESAWRFLQSRPLAPSSLATYHKGLLKLGDYLRLRLQKTRPEKPLNWTCYLQRLPEWLCQGLRQYLAARRRQWSLDRRAVAARSLLCDLTLSLRWLAGHVRLDSPLDLTPTAWYAYLDERLSQGISPATVNSELAAVQTFLRFLQEQDAPICERMLLVEPLPEGPRLPKDVPPSQLRKVYAEIEKEARSEHGLCRRCGLMDRAWFLLMLHGGLRTGEVRRLTFLDFDLERRQVRIEQSKGLKDRIVFLTGAAIEALEAYRQVRGPAEALPEQVFIYRHAPLSISYCYERLLTYGERCQVSLTPHQLRHSCATLLLNAGAPVVSVQAILGHKMIDTTLSYARLYDGTLAADYFRAMSQVEKMLSLSGQPDRSTPDPVELIGLLEALRAEPLTRAQNELVQLLRKGLLALMNQSI